MPAPPQYSHRLDEALALAADAFRTQLRKGTQIPYLTHLLQVMVLVGEHGGDEDQLIAAVLHDYLEDVPGAVREELAGRFGERVALLVEALSDSTTHPKPAWEERKRRYVEHLRHQPRDVKLIGAADKLHNARSIRRDLAALGNTLWDFFWIVPAILFEFYNPPAGFSTELTLMDADGAAITRLTFDDDVVADNQWSPDGRRIVYRTTPNDFPRRPSRIRVLTFDDCAG